MLSSTEPSAAGRTSQLRSSRGSARCKIAQTATQQLSFTVTDQGVEKLQTNINPNKATGPDGISPRVLKELAQDIAPILASLYRCSLDTVEVPSDWRESIVTPV